MIAELHGKYARHRAKLDYSYHMNYTEARQQWQDGIVERVVSQMPPQKRPWLVFTCGPTGAGKGYVMSWLSKCGIFPLENVVHIDSDRPVASPAAKKKKRSKKQKAKHTQRAPCSAQSAHS